MRKFLYPVDTDQFQQIRERGLVYIDKTGYIYDLAYNYRYVFLARPRRFGKSLLCNTFKAYFQGQKELFDGLEITKHEKEWLQYPVLHFDMSQMRNCATLEAMREVLSDMIAQYEHRYNAPKRVDDFGTRFSNLIRHIHNTEKRQVVVIIDEYDTPLMRNLYYEEMKDGIRTLLRSFYQTLKLDGAHLRFAFITGITKFSQLSIFSELNNLNQISMLDDYSGICGITQDELDGVMRPCVAEYADELGISVDEAYTLLKKNYDGYHFSPHSKDVYAPFSLLRALDTRNTGHYWFESGTSAALIEHLRRYPKFNPLDFDGVEFELSDFNAPCEMASTPIPLLYHSGYLSIREYDSEIDTYILHFPNHEVRHGITGCMTNYLLGTDDLNRNATIQRMARALLRGNLSDALTAMRAWIQSIPYDIIEKKEWMQKKDSEAFYQMLIYIVFSLLNSKVDTEVKSIRGRADVVISTRNYIYALELKVDRSADEALQQINSKGYAIPYEAEGRTVVKCGVSISSEERNICHWKITDDRGNVMAEL